FYQPVLVLADVDTLRTLPDRELRAGLAEVIKYGVILDAEFFAWLEAYLDRLLAGEAGALAHAVETSCRLKARIVEADETEQGRRQILNYGHTVGHAVEALTDYRVYVHGEAVAIGMVAAARLAVTLGVLDPSAAERIENLVRRAGLPVELPAGLGAGEILACMARDKKARAGRVTFVLPEAVGRVRIHPDVPPGELRRLCGEARAGGGGGGSL
ncbi:MAG: 3-dehydroquinate synthase, partial [Candidatus Desulforudis sp.]|nr:3-dehydroquinate synthase [Desulforudis sp.]